jgi:addiction module HigA family antidote
MKNPPHPGDFIRTEIIEPAGLSVTAAAAALQVARPTLSSLLNGKADLSGDMALRIEKAFGVKMDTLMRMQASYDIAQTRKREKQIRVRRIHHLADVHARDQPAAGRFHHSRTIRRLARYTVSILLRDRIPLAKGLETQRRHGEVSRPPLRRE